MKCLATLFLLLSILSSRSEDVELQWQANTNAAGYNVYWGTNSGVYYTNIDVGNVTNYTVTNLALGGGYYLAVKYYDGMDVEGDFYSNEVSTEQIDEGNFVSLIGTTMTMSAGVKSIYQMNDANEWYLLTTTTNLTQEVTLRTFSPTYILVNSTYITNQYFRRLFTR